MSTRLCALGIDVGGTRTKAGIVDRDGTVLLRLERPTDATAGTKGVVAIVDDLLGRGAEVGAEITSVGVGAAGFIDFDAGSITFAPNLVYDDPKVAVALRARTGLPVVVDNDANVAAWGERKFGTARGLDDVVLITVGTGIGGGIISGGTMVRGSTGAGAELGHIVMDVDGPQCGCGLRGCFEQMASGQAIERMARDAVERDPASSILAFAGSIDEINAEHVAKAARQYDETARAVLRRAGSYLGIGLSNVTNLFDPDVIVLGGSVVRAGEPFLGPARDKLAQMTQAQKRRPMRIDQAVLGRDAGIIGAAALAFDEAL